MAGAYAAFSAGGGGGGVCILSLSGPHVSSPEKVHPFLTDKKKHLFV